MAGNYDKVREKTTSVVPDNNVTIDELGDQDSGALGHDSTGADNLEDADECDLPGIAIPVVKVPFKLNSDPDLSLGIRGPLYAKVGEPLFPPIVVQFVKHNRMERFRLRPPTSLVTQPTHDSESPAEPLDPEDEKYGMLFNTMHSCAGVKIQLLPVGRDGELFPPEGIIIKDTMNTPAEDERLYIKSYGTDASSTTSGFDGNISTHTYEGVARGIRMKECKEQQDPEGTRYHRKGGHHGGAKKGPTVLYAAFPNVRIPCEGQYKLHVVAMDWMGNPTSHLLSERIITARETELESYEESMNDPAPEELVLLEKLHKHGGFGIINSD